VGWIGLAVTASGCYEERVVGSSLDGLRAIADPKPVRVDAAAGGRGGDTGIASSYSIRVGEYVGVGRSASARAALDEVEKTTGLTGGWMRDTGRSVTAFLGRYSEPNGKVATQALELVRNSGIDQAARASLVPIAPGQTVVTDPLDAKGHPGMYSLQVAVYDADFPTSFRSAAERAARALREQGEEAFYYHGPHRSMVLIGLFTRELDFSSRTGPLGEQVEVYGPRIVELREDYPYNLLNGRRRHLIEQDDGPDAMPLESFVVRIR